MKIKTLLTTALVAVGVGWAGQSARATLTANTGDVFLGFRQGESKGYLINLGNVAQFTAKNGATTTVNTGGNIGLDLASSAGFGSGWFNLESVSWGAVATTFVDFSSTPATLFATRPRSNPSTQSVPWVGRASNAQASTASSFRALASKYRNDGEATANSTRATFQGTGENTWAGFTISPSDFGVFPGIESNFGLGTASSVLDFYQINPGSGNVAEYLGFFSINNSGVISFTAVPEPGTVALMGIGALLVLSRLRRRS